MIRLGLVLLLLSACGTKPPGHQEPPESGPVVLIGFDGADPDLMREWMDQGLLPNISALARQGTFVDLGTTSPPQSPVAWASFATGTYPGKHGIYDFVLRDPSSYLPEVGATSFQEAQFAGDTMVRPPRGKNRRKGLAFWKLLDQEGVAAVVLNVPFDYPMESLSSGRELAGLGTPDLRGTNSIAHAFGSSFDGKQSNPGGMILHPLRLDKEGKAVGMVGGPRGAGGSRSPASITFHRSAEGLSVEAEGIPGFVLEPGQWSELLPLTFHLSSSESTTGLVRFLLVRTEPDLLVYMSAPGADPRHPLFPLSSPLAFASEIAASRGLWKTVGWVHDTSALNAGVLPDQAFLEDARRHAEFRTELTLQQMATQPPLLLSVFTFTDRIGHMFWRLHETESPSWDPVLAKDLGDPIRQAYQDMDTIVGQIVETLDPKARLILLSDHGFHGFHRGLHVNAWLQEQGYLVLKKGVEPGGPCAAVAAFKRGCGGSGVDWSQTRAYALGTGQIYLNRRGREAKGIVEEVEINGLLGQIQQGLEAVRDGGQPVVQHALRGDLLWSGATGDRRPDIQLEFAEGYRSSWETALGSVPKGLFATNHRKWSGDHAASVAAETKGFLLLNWKAEAVSPSIVDIAPSLLSHWGLTPPPEMDGEAFPIAP